MKRLHVVVMISSLVLSGLCTARPLGAAWTDVTVRVYDTGALSHSNRREALAKAAAAFSLTLVAVHWSDCRHAQAPSGASCATPLRPGDFAIRFVRGDIPIGNRGRLRLGDVMLARIQRSSRRSTLSAYDGWRDRLGRTWERFLDGDGRNDRAPHRNSVAPLAPQNAPTRTLQATTRIVSVDGSAAERLSRAPRNPQ